MLDQTRFGEVLNQNHYNYLEFWGDFLTVGGYSIYYGIHVKSAAKTINKGRLVHESQFGPITDLANRHAGG